MSEQPSLSFTIMENTCILIHGRQSPSDEGWREYLQAMREHRFTAPPRVLVFSDGSGPTPTQRQALTKSTGGHPYVCSIIAEAANIRFISASLALANPNVKSFYPNQLTEALSYLQLSPNQIKDLTQTLSALNTKLKHDVLTRALQS